MAWERGQTRSVIIVVQKSKKSGRMLILVHPFVLSSIVHFNHPIPTIYVIVAMQPLYAYYIVLATDGQLQNCPSKKHVLAIRESVCRHLNIKSYPSQARGRVSFGYMHM